MIPRLPFSFITAEQLSEKVGLTVERINELVDAGYLPHHRFDGNGPYFKTAEATAWVKDNLTESTGGMRMPRSCNVMASAPVKPFIGDVPSEIRAIEGLLSFPDMPSFPPAIYFLCRNGRVVYVGQSTSLIARIYTHRAEKAFDRVFFIPCPASELNRVEGSFIRALRPELNGSAPVASKEDIERVRLMLASPPPACGADRGRA